MAMLRIAIVAALVAGGVCAKQPLGHAARAFFTHGEQLPAMAALCGNAPHSCIEEPLRVGVWNLQRFGVGKMRKPAVVDVIVKVVHTYDLLVLQEVTDSSGTAIPALLDKINEKLAADERYSVEQSPRIGRRSYKEQYVFLYKSKRVSYDYGYKYHDKDDIFQVEPFVAIFNTKSTGPLTRFAVIPLHAKPSKAVEELNALADVYDEMVSKTGLADSIIIGDFNAGCTYIVQGEIEGIRLYSDPKFHWLISDHADTTTKTTSCPYDRIIVTGPAFQKAAYYKTASPYYFDEVLGIESDWALVKAVSDHYPVGVMVRGTVPKNIVTAYPLAAAEADTAENGPASSRSSVTSAVRTSLSVELPQQQCWAQVVGVIHGMPGSDSFQRDDASEGDGRDIRPQVVATAGISMAEWHAGSLDAAISVLTQLSEMHPHLVTKEAVAVLGYKAGHTALADPSLYGPHTAPTDVRLAIMCREVEGRPHCTATLSAATGLN